LAPTVELVVLLPVVVEDEVVAADEVEDVALST
jgi:hypothetical protein